MDFFDRQDAQRRAATQARHAQEAADRVPLHASQARWEYRVLTQTALAGWRDGTIDGLESLVNVYAEGGWRVIAMSFTGQINQTMATDKNHLYIVLERPASDGGHLGHPVEPRPTAAVD